MSKPVIGLVPLFDYEKESYWMLPGYIEGIKENGGIPLILPITDNEEDIDQLAEMVDGLLFTGGQDISPSLYNEDRIDECEEPSVERDEMETILFNKALIYDKPVLGICRGIEMINVMLGGTLYQDIDSQYKTTIEHHQCPPYDDYCHKVKVTENTPLFYLLKQKRIKVNSVHHQGIKDLSSKLKVMATSTDGLIEAVYFPDKTFVWAIQWHPEYMYETDKNSQLIFKQFVYACK